MVVPCKFRCLFAFRLIIIIIQGSALNNDLKLMLWCDGGSVAEWLGCWIWDS